MIARVWRGWASTPTDALAYEVHFGSTVLPGLRRVMGFLEARLLRRADGGEVEFVAITVFDSINAVRGFAGDDYERAVVEPEARRVLSRFDERSAHYELVAYTGALP